MKNTKKEKRFTFKISHEDFETLRQIAENKTLAVGSLIRMVLVEFIKSKGKK